MTRGDPVAEAHPPPTTQDASTGELVGRLSQQMSTLVRDDGGPDRGGRGSEARRPDSEGAPPVTSDQGSTGPADETAPLPMGEEARQENPSTSPRPTSPPPSSPPPGYEPGGPLAGSLP